MTNVAAPLAFDHSAGTALQRRTAIGTADAITRTLARPAAAGASEIELDDITNLQTGGNDMLELEAANSTEHELLITAGFVMPAGTTRAIVRLATPLAFAHAQGTLVQRVQFSFSGLGALVREAQRGDRVLFSTSLTNVGTNDVLRIASGTPRAELRFVRRFPTYDSGTHSFAHPVTLAPDGTFALPPIARVDLVPDYRGDTTLQILFKP